MVLGLTDKGDFGIFKFSFRLQYSHCFYRTELQRAFFPPTYLDSAVTPVLKPGEKRVWANLQVFIELRDSTTLHVPFREASKVPLHVSLN